MQNEDVIRAVEEKVEELLTDRPSHFLVDIRIKPTNNIKVFIDADEGISLASLIDYNRKLYKQFEGTGFFPEDNFSLEVSSPGLDEPIKLNRQYKKNIGRFVDVTMNDGNKVEGKLLEATEEAIIVETETGKARPANHRSDGGKKKEVKQQTLPLTDIKTTKIQIKF